MKMAERLTEPRDDYKYFKGNKLNIWKYRDWYSYKIYESISFLGLR